MTKVLMLLSNSYRPDPRVQREALALSEAGYEVTIAAWDRTGGLPEQEESNGISIHRFGPTQHTGGAVRFLRGLRTFWKNALIYASREEWDVIHAHDLDTLSPALKLGSKMSIPVVFDAHEIYSEMVKNDIPIILYKLLRLYEKRKMRKADAIIAVTDAVANLFSRIAGENVSIVMNCRDIDTTTKREDFAGDGLIAIYIGVLEPERKLEDLVERIPEKCPGVTLVIGGYGSLEEELKEKMGENATFLGPVPPDRVPALSKGANVLLAIYNPKNTNNRMSVPNKLFEAMAYGKPIIVSKGSWAGDVVEEEKCGIAIEYDGDAVFQALKELRDDPKMLETLGANGLRAHKQKYNWRAEKRKLVELYRGLDGKAK